MDNNKKRDTEKTELKGNQEIEKYSVGLFDSRAAVERAMEELKTRGFLANDISVFFSNIEVSKSFSKEKGTKAISGTISDSAKSMGISDIEAKRYDSAVKSGGILMSVWSNRPEMMKKAKEVMKAAGSRELSSEAQRHEGKTASGF